MRITASASTNLAPSVRPKVNQCPERWPCNNVSTSPLESVCNRRNSDPSLQSLISYPSLVSHPHAAPLPAQPPLQPGVFSIAARNMPTIADGVDFDTVAREWRCKWSPDGEKSSLVAAQNALSEVLAEVKGVPGVKGVQRVVCGGCLDFKVVTSMTADTFGDWEGKSFAPEAAFLEKIKGIDGITEVETQTYTLMPM